MTEKPSATFVGSVEKIIRPVEPGEPGKAQIVIEGADHLYREIRIDNTLTDATGDEVHLKQAAKVDVTIEAHSHGGTTEVDHRD